MPHMSNMPWMFIYFVAASLFMMFVSKENFNVKEQNLKIKSLQNTTKTSTWMW